MQLSIRDVVFETFQFLRDNRVDLLRMMAAPVLTLAIVGLAVSAMVWSDHPIKSISDLTPMQITGRILNAVLSTVFYVMFAVAWHRRCLKPEEQTTILSALRWDKRKTLFLLRCLAISLIALALSLPAAVIGAIVGGALAMALASAGIGGHAMGAYVTMLAKFAVLIPIVLVQVRLALWLPAAAVDHKMTVMEAWTIGRQNTWRLVAIFLFSIAPAMVVIFLVASGLTAIAHATGLSGSLTFRFLVGLALNFIYYIVIAASVSALSISYRELRRPPSRGMPFYV